MRITNTQKNKFPTSIALVMASTILLSVFLITRDSTTSSNAASHSSLAINRATTAEEISYNSLLNATEYRVYQDSDLSIYLAYAAGVPKLIYLYNGTLQDRELSDHFFLHVYVKDVTKLRGNATYANVDFIQNPKTITIEDQVYTVFQKDLVSGNYNESFIPVENIAFFNTGRYKPKSGRSLDLKKITVDPIAKARLKNKLEKITLFLSSKDFEKIKTKRTEALKIGILTTDDDDYVKGSIQYANEDIKKMKLRLKGDWTDHLKHDRKWSFRILMDNNQTLRGMRKFSIQHPTVRYYLWEWLFHRAIKNEDLIGLRYDFVDTTLKIEGSNHQEIPLGIMAFEESFDKILIENNKKREGLVLAFDESLLWQDRVKQQTLGLERNAQSKELHSFINAPIKVFNENKVLSDPILSKQFEVAKDLLDGLRQKKLSISEVFDVDRLTTFVALSNLFGGNHGLIWHNLRIYYNPITNKMEPISFDSGSGMKINSIIDYPLVHEDPIYKEMLLQKLKKYSDPTFFNGFISRHANGLQSLQSDFYTEFEAELNLDVIAHNSNFIKKQLHPAVAVTANFIEYDTTSISVQIKNVSKYAVRIEELKDDQGFVLGKPKGEVLLQPNKSKTLRFELSTYFVNAFVSKKNKKGSFQYPKDVAKLRLLHSISGVNAPREITLNPYGTNHDLRARVTRYKKSKKATFQNFPFVLLKEEGVLEIGDGKHTIEQDLIIPENYTLKILPGARLNLINGASIISESNLLCEGTNQKPILFNSSDKSGGGIFISNTSSLSRVSYTQFDYLSNPRSTIWEVSGAVNFHESDVSISNSIFKNNRCEDGLNIIRSSFSIIDTHFEASQSDAFDGDFVSGYLERCSFVNSGNDGIDVSGSQIKLTDITITNPADKAISAGENSTITGKNITINGGEIGVVSKDLSRVQLTDLTILDTRLGLSAFQKKTAYGVATISVSNLSLQNIELNYLIENNSSLRIDDIAVKTVSNNVIDQMYGKEYGKSSK